jgi:DNA-binding transcriptional LysR family regulator
MNLRSIDLNLLVLFEALITERSITGAANKVGITPSAMSHALSRLRQTFNDELLERTGRGMVPTQRALDLWKSLSGALEQVQRSVEQQLEFDPRVSERKFTLRLSDYHTQCVLPRLCSRIFVEAPNVTLLVRDLTDDRPWTDDPGDIQLRACASDWGEQYRHQCLWRSPFVVAMRPSHPAAGRDMTLDLYLSLPHVAVTGVGARLVDAWLARQGLSRRIALTLPNLAGLVAIVQNSDLCAVLPESWVKLYAAPDKLATAALPFDVDYTIDLLWRALDERDGGHRWLRKLIVDEVALVTGAADWAGASPPDRLDRVPVGTGRVA